MDDAIPSTPTMFKKPKTKSTRPRPSSPMNDGASTVEEPYSEGSPITLAAKLKNKHKTRTKSRLSFGGDEEEADGEVFQVKRSNLSRKLALGSHPSSPAVALPPNLDQASISQSSTPAYTKEYLSELKASTPSTPLKRETITAYDVDISFDAGDVSNITTESIDLSEMAIPTESSITSAKQKRERLRTSKASDPEEDYISLSLTRKEDIESGPHPESRLVREEDELGEGDDEYSEYTSAQERIALGKKAKKKEAAQRRDAMQELIDDAEDEDEESLRWEQEQLRRGAREDMATDDSSKSTKASYVAAAIPTPVPLPNLGTAIARLTQSLTDLTTSHTANTAAMTSLSDEREVLDVKEKEMRNMVLKAESKRSWFSAFREWVETVASFLDDKYPLLEKLEEEYVSLLKERSSMVYQRRQLDDEDDLATFYGTPAIEGVPEPEEVDELGRMKQNQYSRESRRQRRTARSQRRKERAQSEEEEGYSTDSDLSPADALDFDTALLKLNSKADDVLSDVRSVEFKDPSLGVGKWFGEWREKYDDSYSGAYGGLGMISAWEFWVRLEIVGWNPMEDSRPLDSFAWYGSLYEYSRIRSSSGFVGDEEEMGPDGDLVSAMISTALVPRICHIVQGGAFDPYSARHMRKLRDLAEQIEASATREKFEMMLKSVTTPFRDAVNVTLELVIKYRKAQTIAFDPLSASSRQRFLFRRYKLLLNMVRWKKYAGDRFGIGELLAKVVQECMMPVAETGWDIGGKGLMRKALDALPIEDRPTKLLSLL